MCVLILPCPWKDRKKKRKKPCQCYSNSYKTETSALILDDISYALELGTRNANTACAVANEIGVQESLSLPHLKL